MEMNFPHKDLEKAAFDDNAAVVTKVAGRQALFAHAIARQASSQSARYYDAASKGLPSPQTAVPDSFMDNRMAFFAGRVRSDMTGRKKTTLFGTGCFRPDLANRKIDDMHE